MTAAPIPEPSSLPPDPAEETLLNADQIASMLGGGNITASTVIRRWRSWGLTGHRIGKALRWRESEVIDFINSHPA